MKAYFPVAIVLAVLAISGCAVVPPFSHDVSPVIKGRITDAQSGFPIVGAVVNVSRAEFTGGTKSLSTGDYTLSPLREWHYLIYIGDPGFYPTPLRVRDPGAPLILKVSAPGYEPQSRTLQADLGGNIVAPDSGKIDFKLSSLPNR